MESARKREREKEGHEDPSLWWNKGALLNSVWIYIPYYKVASSDKDQKTRLYKLPRKQGVIEALKPKDNPYQKRVLDNPFQHKEKLMKENSSRKLDTKGTFYAKMGSIKDRNGMDLTETRY